MSQIFYFRDISEFQNKEKSFLKSSRNVVFDLSSLMMKEILFSSSFLDLPSSRMFLLIQLISSPLTFNFNSNSLILYRKSFLELSVVTISLTIAIVLFLKDSESEWILKALDLIIS